MKYWPEKHDEQWFVVCEDRDPEGRRRKSHMRVRDEDVANATVALLAEPGPGVVLKPKDLDRLRRITTFIGCPMVGCPMVGNGAWFDRLKVTDDCLRDILARAGYDIESLGEQQFAGDEELREWAAKEGE